MAILAFQKPDEVIMHEASDTFGRFEFRPLEPGYGTTIGNALRRILLSSLEGYAITAIKISGVDHEFDSIPGVIENVVDIILNLKQVRFKLMLEGEESETVTIKLSGKQQFIAEDISKQLSAFKVLNPELHICSMEPSVSLNIELTINKGRGYVPAEENSTEDAPFGVIPIDSIFTPIKNVNFSVDKWRVEQKTDYDKLNLEISTDGSIHPKDALKEAAKILIYHFMLFSDEKIVFDSVEKSQSNELDEESLRVRHVLLTKLGDLELSVRALNCLKAAEVNTLADLVSLQKSDLMKFRNFGKKSLAEVDSVVEKFRLHFGMDITKYNIEKKELKNEA
ncbi:MAG: DNA-directed RNA polymerase subunit alpha [Bacteroidales bacterium]